MSVENQDSADITFDETKYRITCAKSIYNQHVQSTTSRKNIQPSI